MSTTTIRATAVSAANKVQSELDVLTTRLRRDVWLSGLLTVAAVAVGMLLVAIVFDASFQPESTSLRFVLLSCIVAAVAVATYRFVWRPLKTRGNTLDLAWSLEAQRPELQETLTSTLLLADNQQPAAAALVEAVAAQANRNLADCRDDSATRRDMRIPALAASSCVVVATLCFAVWPQYLAPSLSNVMAPWNIRQLPYLTATISPGDIAVAQGEALAVSAWGHDLDSCLLEFMEGDQVLSSTPMTATKIGNEATALLPKLTTDRTYRVRSGSCVSNNYRITVHPRPVVTSAKATLQFPQYTGIESATIDDLSAPMAAVPGTLVNFSVETNNPTPNTRLMFGNQKQPPAKTVPTKDSWWHHWDLPVDSERVQAGHLELISEHDVSSEPFSFEIRTLPDQLPTVSIKTPTLQQLTVQPDGRLPISFKAADDFGVQSIEILFQTGETNPQREVILQDPAAASHAAEYVFAPQQHDLEVGDQLVLWFVATDNRTDEYGGAQTAKSRQLMINVTDDAMSVGGQQVIDEQNQMAESLSAAIERLQEAKENAQRIADAAQQADANGAKDVPAEANAGAQKLQQQLQDAQKALENATESDDDDAGMFEAEKQQVRDIANEDVEDARQQARMIPLTSDPQQQRQAADAARSAIEQAEEKLAALQEQLNDRADKLQQAAELDELARQQNELARQMEEQEQFPQEAKPKQEEIADRLQDLVEEDLDAKSEQFRQRTDAAEQLVEKTDQLQEQQQQLTNATEQKTDEETRELLSQMIRKEQLAVAAEHQQLMDQAQQDDAEPKNQQPAADTQQLMEQATKDLDEKNLQAAEQNAKKAKEKLREAAARNAAADKDTQQQATSKKQKRLAKRQETIEDAIQAVDEDNFEAAADELQELITDRLEQVKDDAEALFELPTDDEQNQRAGDKAQQKLQEALEDSKQAATKAQDERQGHPENKQDAKQKQAEQQAQQQQQQQQQQQPVQQDKKNGQPQAQQPDNQKNEQTAKQDTPDLNQAQQQQQQQPDQQEEKNGQPQSQQRQKQDKAAKSLKKASESLQQFCKSCRKCANCNKPSRSGESSGSTSPSGNKPSGNKPASGKQPGQSGKKQSGPSKQLAKATDNAQNAARQPTPGAATQLAEELDKLADDAAQKSGYPKRKDDKGRSSRDKKGAQQNNSGTDKKKGAQDGSKSASSEPNGVDGNGQPDDVNTKGIQLRGPSSSEWTRSQKRLRGNVLDSKSTQIPEAYRGVVEDYFQQLSKIDADEEQSGASQ
ncbi:MAG: DUF4175 family protein [Fuerstiella sp.]